VKVLLGVSGGIAAYKAADLVSRCRKEDWSVRVVMTRGAQQFVTPLTFEALSGHPVMTDALATGATPDGVSAIEHIRWAKWADVAIVAPLTSSTLAKLATGLADDALTTVWMALPRSVPSLLAPAMNTAMWEQPVVQRNLRWLAELERHVLVPPVAKRLACGDVGVGGLAEVDTLVAALAAHG
jgi:phosphopantothenoylcysteine decarboxylase/phosphopantothenate--cysteine ligase